MKHYKTKIGRPDALAVYSVRCKLIWISFRVSGSPKNRSALCLPQIKREHIGDAVHPGSDGTECVLLPRRNVISAHPCSRIDECACHCSIGRKISECGADAPRPGQ